MTRLLYVFLLLVLPFAAPRARAERYVDYAFVPASVSGQARLLVLTDSGRVHLYDFATLSRIPFTPAHNGQIVLLSTDGQGLPVYMARKGQLVFSSGAAPVMAPAAVVKAQPWFLPFDSQGNAYAVHQKGITDLATGKTYFAENSINYQVNMHTSWRKPQCHFMDSHDNLWLGFGFGEWGGEVLAFSCTQKKFLTLHTDSFIMALWPIKSFFEDASGVYLTAGLMHFSTQGCLARFDAAQKLHTLFESEGRRGDPETAGEYIGPGTYNPYDGHIYFYSQNGIFRGDPKGDLSSIYRWQKVLQPQLSWRSGQPDAVGAPMNVLKLTVPAPGRLLFLSQNEGIGV